MMSAIDNIVVMTLMFFNVGLHVMCCSTNDLSENIHVFYHYYYYYYDGMCLQMSQEV